MARRRKGPPKEKQPPKVNFKPIDRERGGKITEPYAIMERLIGKHHKDLLEAEARMLIGWDNGPAKPDADGYIKFGRVRKGSDVDRECAAFDVLLVIRQEVWNSFDNTRKHAEIDRLLCRIAVVRDPHGEIVVDERGRSRLRLRRPVEVFPENVARYGFHQEPKLTECLTRYNDSQRPLLADKPRPAKGFNQPALDKGESPPDSHLKNGGNGKAGKSKKSKPAEEPASPGTTKLSALDLPYQITNLCKEAGLLTVEDVVKLHEERGAIGLHDISGMGSERAETLWSAVEKFMAEHAVGAK